MRCRTVSLCVAAVLWIWPGTAASQEQGSFEPYVGEVTGNNVYVRSGADANYYPVTKLNAGDRVVVVGEQWGWLKIVPPEGCFSLIDKNFVDRGVDDLGVVNGDRVRVYAGSELSDRRYARQVQLPKGAEVKILGELPEAGYYKIAPPKGAYLWISSRFVRRVPGAVPGEQMPPRVRPPAPKPREPEPKPGPTTRPAGPTATRPAAGPVASRPTATRPAPKPKPKPSNKYAKLLEAIEQDLEIEFRKPLGARRLDVFIGRLEPIAKQQEEEIPRLRAQEWIRQLKLRMAIAEEVRRIEAERERVNAVIQRGETERAALQAMARGQQKRPFDAQGEFRKSYAFPASERMYRLVDPNMSPPRTVAYVQIPEDSAIDPQAYLGRIVGVRAASKRPLRDVVNPTYVIVPEEIVVLPQQEPPAAPTSGPSAAE